MGGRKFTLEDQGDINDFLGIQVRKHQNSTIHLTQPQLIDAILKDLHLQDNSNPRETLALSTRILHKDSDGEDMKPEFYYWSMIGKLNFLEKSTRPDIAYAVHQCARFSVVPKKSHAKAVKRIGRYLKGMKDKAMILKPDQTRSFNSWVDAGFSGNWNQELAHTMTLQQVYLELVGQLLMQLALSLGHLRCKPRWHY